MAADPTSLAGKTAIVTGGSRGIGAGCARELARKGANVVITYTTSVDRADALCKELTTAKNRVVALQADSYDRDHPEKIVSATLKEFPNGIDILVHNAGTGVFKSLDQLNMDDYNKVFDLNVVAPFLLTKAVLPHLNRPGRIITISSIASRLGGTGTASLLNASKAAMEGFTRSWASEFGHDGTTVNCVNPGATDTEILAQAPEGLVKSFTDLTPLQRRLGTTDEVGHSVAFLASDAARFITGQCLMVCGGSAMI